MRDHINQSWVCRGHSFFTTNEELLDRYAECPGSAEVIAVQTAYLDSLHAAPRSVPGAGVYKSCHVFWPGISMRVHSRFPSTAGAAHDTLSKYLVSCAGTVRSILHLADHPSGDFLHVGAGESDDYLADVDLPPSSSGSDAESLVDEAEDADETSASARAQHNGERYAQCVVIWHSAGLSQH